MEYITHLRNHIAQGLGSKFLCSLSVVALGAGLYFKRKLIKRNIKHFIGKLSYQMEKCSYSYKKTLRPEKIIIMRHGESEANIDDNLYAKLPDNQIELTQTGLDQAFRMGQMLKEEIGNDRKVIFFVSPYLRAQQTANEIIKSFPDYEKIITEPRIREQEWGNLQKFQNNEKESEEIFKERSYVGRFYYRFKQGESASDVYDRVSLFLETLFREMDSYSCASNDGQKRVIVIITHGMVMRLFTMRYFRKHVSDFEKMGNPFNCESWVFNKSQNGIYTQGKKLLLKEFQDGGQQQNI